ncbi:17820_t:CDS:2, partial [Racocetra persica]
RSDAIGDYGAPCGERDFNPTTVSSFPIKGYSTVAHNHDTNGTLFYLYSNDGGAKFNPVAEPIFYNVTNRLGENLTTFVDLTKAGATVGTKGILQTYFIQGNDTSPTNTTWYMCADIKIIDELDKVSSAVSINAPHVGNSNLP